MGSGTVLSWVLIGLFGATGLYYATRAVLRWGTRATVATVLDDVLHLLMSAAMIAMEGSAPVPTSASVIAFAAATAWFAGRAVRATRTCGRHGHDGHPVAALWYHAGMMASMAWMAIAMTAMTAHQVTGPTPSTPDSAGTAGMAGMPMPAGTGDPAHPAATSWVVLPDLLLVIAFSTATGWLLLTACRVRYRDAAALPATGALANAVMAVGMALAFLQLAMP